MVEQRFVNVGVFCQNIAAHHLVAGKIKRLFRLAGIKSLVQRSLVKVFSKPV